VIWSWLGKHYYKKKNYNKAAKYLIKSKSFTSVDDYVRLAESLHYADRSEDALKVMADGISRFPASSYLYERRAHLLREMYREEEAIRDLESNRYSWPSIFAYPLAGIQLTL